MPTALTVQDTRCSRPGSPAPRCCTHRRVRAEAEAVGPEVRAARRVVEQRDAADDDLLAVDVVVHVRDVLDAAVARSHVPVR